MFAATLKVTPPKEFKEAWSKMGLDEKPPSNKGPKAWWLRQLIALTPLSWWSRFQLSPDKLIKAAAKNRWKNDLLTGWREAVAAQANATWANALIAVEPEDYSILPDGFFTGMTASRRDGFLESYLARATHAGKYSEVNQALRFCPGEMPQRVSEAVAKLLRRGLMPKHDDYSLRARMGEIALRVHRKTFHLFEPIGQDLNRTEALDRYHAILNLRREMYEEFSP